jgi:hypothetical protein
MLTLGLQWYQAMQNMPVQGRRLYPFILINEFWSAILLLHMGKNKILPCLFSFLL